VTVIGGCVISACVQPTKVATSTPSAANFLTIIMRYPIFPPATLFEAAVDAQPLRATGSPEFPPSKNSLLISGQIPHFFPYPYYQHLQ
jgi:hypothetical protein